MYIHGGGYYLGAATEENFLPTPLAAVGDVIVVGMNYRLGALGFLSTSKLANWRRLVYIYR